MTNGGQRPDPSGFQIENEMDLFSGARIRILRARVARLAELLQRLARRELPIGDSAYDHIGKCSPCYQELRPPSSRRMPRNPLLVKRRRTVLAAAAVLVTASPGLGLC